MELEKSLKANQKKAINELRSNAQSRKHLKFKQLASLFGKCGINLSTKKGNGSHRVLLTPENKPICYPDGRPISLPTKFGNGTFI